MATLLKKKKDIDVQIAAVGLSKTIYNGYSKGGTGG